MTIIDKEPLWSEEGRLLGWSIYATADERALMIDRAYNTQVVREMQQLLGVEAYHDAPYRCYRIFGFLPFTPEFPMKLKIRFKTPDAVQDAIKLALDAVEKPEGVSNEEWEEILRTRRRELERKADGFFPFLEYCTVVWDTEKNTVEHQRV